MIKYFEVLKTEDNHIKDMENLGIRVLNHKDNNDTLIFKIEIPEEEKFSIWKKFIKIDWFPLIFK